MSNEVGNEEESLLDRFLLFRLGEKIYGAPLLSIKEVIKLQNIEEVPFTESFFKGVINLRGSLISCIDVRLKFGMKELENEKKFADVSWSIKGNKRFIVCYPEGMRNYGRHIDWDMLEVCEPPINVSDEQIQTVLDIEY